MTLIYIIYDNTNLEKAR